VHDPIAREAPVTEERYTPEYHHTPELHAAVRFIRSLREGDRVVVTHGMGPVVMTVMRTAHRPEIPDAPYESIGVVVATGHGYVLRVPAQSLVDRFTTDPHKGRTAPDDRVSMRRAYPADA
jgi:carbamate kinase